MKKVLVVYFSQTGQLTRIVESITASLKNAADIVFEELKPVPAYPFPWHGMPFFQVFPESVIEIPCKLEPFTFNPEDKYDLIILAYQVWFLSPSIPITSFLQTPEAKILIKGKLVVTILGVRNMWVMAQERIKSRINDLGGKLIGNIVLIDPSPNLVSVMTIVRWMMKGERVSKSSFGRILPPAGVPEKDIIMSSRFGDTIRESLRTGDWDGLQGRLLTQGAVQVDPVLLSIEKRGKMMFGIWSKLVLKKGAYNDPEREGMLRLFKYYLFTVIYLISPVASLIFWLMHNLNRSRMRKIVEKYSSVQPSGL